MQFDLADIRPGPVVAAWEDLLATLDARWQAHTYHDMRARLRRKAFDDLPQDQAVPKLLAFMREQHWLT